jgi:hypothetical protein
MRVVSENDYRKAFLLAQFTDHWQTHVGNVCECPTDEQILRWYKMAKWDFALLAASIEDLKCRAKHPMNPVDPYGHCIKHVSAAIIRRACAKYRRKAMYEERVAA